MKLIWSSQGYFRLWRFYPSFDVLSLFEYDQREAVQFTGVGRMDITTGFNRPSIYDVSELASELYPDIELRGSNKLYRIVSEGGTYHLTASNLWTMSDCPRPFGGDQVYGPGWIRID